MLIFLLFIPSLFFLILSLKNFRTGYELRNSDLYFVGAINLAECIFLFLFPYIGIELKMSASTVFFASIASIMLLYLIFESVNFRLDLADHIIPEEENEILSIDDIIDTPNLLIPVDNENALIFFSFLTRYAKDNGVELKFVGDLKRDDIREVFKKDKEAFFILKSLACYFEIKNVSEETEILSYLNS